MTKIKRGLVLAGMLLLLVGCSPAMKSGTVVDKHYKPAHTVTTMMKVGDVWMPMTNRYSETFNLKISGKDIKGKEVIRWQRVSEELYEQKEIGDQFMEADLIE